MASLDIHGDRSAASAPRGGSTVVFARGVDPSVALLSSALNLLDVGHRSLRSSYADRLGLALSELNALLLVGETGGVTPKRVAAALGLTTGAVTAMTDRLQAAKLLERHPNPRDKRSVVLRLTADGTRAVTWVYDAYYAAVAGALASAEGLADPVFAALLERVAVSITAAAEGLRAPQF